MYYSAVNNWQYLSLLRTHHRVIVEVFILDNQRRYLSNATSRLISGTVDMDSTADVTRSGKVALLDPLNDLGLDFNGQSMGSQYYNRMVQVVHRIQHLDNPSSYGIPIFTGPITDANRDGAIINLEFKGMEHFASAGVMSDYSWPAGAPRSAIIKQALGFHGELYFNDQSGGTQALASNWSVEGGDNLWSKLKEFAAGMGCDLFYDGNGVCQIRPKNSVPIFLIDSSWLTEEPDVLFDSDRIKNVVRVEGATMPTASGEAARMYMEAWPPPQHPFSPQSLARNGQPRVLAQVIKDESLASWGDLSSTAQAVLDDNLLSCAGATAVIVTAPFLEENDAILIDHPKLHIAVNLEKWTIPLTGDTEMSLNMFSTTSSGPTGKANFVANANLFGGRLMQPGVSHGPSGAFNGLAHHGTRGENAYGANGNGGMKPPKKKKNRGKKGKGKK